MRALIYPRNQVKPQLGTPLFGNNNLVNGLQLAILLNERASGGPLIGGTGSNLKIYDIRRKRIGTGIGIVGPTPPQNNWVMTHRGYGFVNNSSGTGGAIDFGTQSSYPTFTTISCMVMAGFNPGLGANSNRVVMSYDGATINFVISMDQTNNKWTVQVNTAGGAVFVEFAPSHLSDPKFMDTVAFTYTGTTLTGYLNGRSQGTAAGNALSFVGAAKIQLSGTSLVNNQNSVEPITGFWLWNRVLNAREIQQMYTDPYWSLSAKTNSHRSGLAGPPVPPGTVPLAFGVWGR